MTTPAPTVQPPQALRGTDGPWAGKNGLWVNLWYMDPSTTINRVGGSYRLKFGTMTLHEGEFTSRYGPPTVRADRVGGSGSVRGSTGGYAHQGDTGFWPTVVRFPSRGCWLITTTWRDTPVRVVLKVP